VVVGIDGGGSRTRAALVDADGRVLGVGAAAGSNAQDVGDVAAGRQLRAAVATAWASSGQTGEALAAVGCGLAGLVTKADRALARQALTHAGLLTEDTPLVLESDGAAAIAGAHLGAPGLALIAGTGSACYGLAADGRRWRSGGWGWWLGDEGSGTWIGREGLIAVARARDGRGPETALTRPLLVALACDEPDDLLHRTYVLGLDRVGTAALAPTVLAVANEGDGVANEIVDRAAEQLVDTVVACRGALGLERPPLSLTGGLAAAALLRARVSAALARRDVAVDLVDPALAPVFGAALLALGALGPVSSEALRTLRSTSAMWPPDASGHR
jgi:glucosamine kinase